MMRLLSTAAALLAATAAVAVAGEPRAAHAGAGDASSAPLRLAQSVNETLPGGVEHQPGDAASEKTRSAAPRALKALPPPPAPVPAGAAMTAPTGSGKADAAKSSTGAGKKASKKAAPGKTEPPTLERAPATSAPAPGSVRGAPRPIRPDDSIPGGAERSPGNAQ